MTSTPASAPIAAGAAGTEEDAPKRIARLERRVERERAARREAEVIADRGMRDLWLANRDLDRRVAERTEELEEALAQLEAAFAGAAGFFSNLSHEMLTPLNGITGMLELLNEHAHDEATKSYVTAAMASSSRLSRLIHRLLDVVEYRSGRITSHVETTTASALVDSFKERWLVEALQRQKLLTVSQSIGEDELRTDVSRASQIADELIENAIIHGDPGVVTVAIGLEDAAGVGERALHIAVADDGPGFAVPAETGLVATFAGLDTSPGRATDGMGLGLMLAGMVASELGGRVRVDSAVGTGTVAHLWLPQG